MAGMPHILKPCSVPAPLCVEIRGGTPCRVLGPVSCLCATCRPATSTAGTSQDMLHRLPPGLGYKRTHARYSLPAVTFVTQQRALHASAQSHPACGERTDYHCSPLPGTADIPCCMQQNRTDATDVVRKLPHYSMSRGCAGRNVMLRGNPCQWLLELYINPKLGFSAQIAAQNAKVCSLLDLTTSICRSSLSVLFARHEGGRAH